MHIELEFFQAERRIRNEMTNDELVIELWDYHNVIITRKVNGEVDTNYDFEISKEDAVKMAKVILAQYDNAESK